jgi:hypothetical protein
MIEFLDYSVELIIEFLGCSVASPRIYMSGVIGMINMYTSLPWYQTYLEKVPAIFASPRPIDKYRSQEEEGYS